MARFRHKLADLIRGLPTLSLTSLELMLRRPRSVARFQAQILRLRRTALGQDLPSIFPGELLEASRPYSLRLGVEQLDLDYYPDLLLAKLVAILQPDSVFELGTYVGASTRTIASQGPEGMRIYTLDLPPDAIATREMTDLHLIEKSKRELGCLFRGTRWEKNVTQLFGDSMSFDFTPYHRAMDLVYVDGSHSYAYVVSDTKNAVAMIRPGGVIVWDDYGSMRSEYGTTRYLDGLREKGFPVFQLGTPGNRAAMRATQEVIDRFEAEQPS